MRIVRILLAVCLFCLTLEVCARVDDLVRYGAPFWSNYSYEAIFTSDALGRKGRPFASFRDYRLNSLGFRGPEVVPGGVRVICIGASETFGLYEDPGEEFPRQLERDLNLNSGTRKYQVVNTALVGETIRSATIRIPEIIDEVHPQFAVIYPTPANYIWLPWVLKAPGAHPQTDAGFQPRVLDKIRDAIKRFSPPGLLDYLRKRDIAHEAPEFGKPMDRLPERNVEVFRQDLVQLIDTLEKKGVQPVLVTHANRFGDVLSKEDRRQLTAWRRFYPMLTEAGFLDMERRMNDAVRQVAAERNLSLIDGARIVPPGSEYFGDAIHFTTRGSTLLAQAISNAILQR